MVLQSFSILATSDPANGARFTSPLTNEFTVDCSVYPIYVPGNAKSCRLKVTQASIPYVSPNIVANVNDTFTFYYPTLLDQNDIIIPQGLYGLSDLAATIQLGLSNLALPTNLFTFYGDQSTQHLYITTNQSLQMDFSVPRNFAAILGFNQQKYPLASLSTIAQIFYSPNAAGFDTLTSYLLSSDIISTGIPINGSYSATIIASIPISNVSVGGRLVYDPQNAQPVMCNELIGNKKTTMRFSLLDNRGKNIDMLNQYWSAIVTIEYET